MIRVTCPHCEYAQEYSDDRAGMELPCQWCGDPLTAGGPDAEHVPDYVHEPAPTVRGAVARVIASLCTLVAFVFFVIAAVGLPVLDFGFGYRFRDIRPIELYWILFPLALGLQRVADWLLGETAEPEPAKS